MVKSKGVVLANVSWRINKLGFVASGDLGKCVRHPEGMRRRLLCRDGILAEENHALADYELTTAFHRSRILIHYQFKDEAWRQTASVGNTQILEREEPDLQSREQFLAYLRTIDRQMQNEMGGRNRRGGGDTYDRSKAEEMIRLQRYRKKWPPRNIATYQ